MVNDKGGTQLFVCTECKSWIPETAREFHAKRCARKRKLVKNTVTATKL